MTTKEVPPFPPPICFQSPKGNYLAFKQIWYYITPLYFLLLPTTKLTEESISNAKKYLKLFYHRLDGIYDEHAQKFIFHLLGTGSFNQFS